jgi:T-complex protein 1 subunit alpha
MATAAAAAATNLLQILVELADLQDQEVGDGTTSVVILAAELLKRANDLVRAKIHPTSIIAGYRLAMREVSNVCKHAKHAGHAATRSTLVMTTAAAFNSSRFLNSSSVYSWWGLLACCSAVRAKIHPTSNSSSSSNRQPKRLHCGLQQVRCNVCQ